MSSLRSSPSAAARQIPQSARGANGDDDLRRKLKEQVEANDKLKKENETLREVVVRKDATIAELIRDLQNRASTTADRCNKTESTSRESDEHLRDREVAILQRKNRRLRKTLQEKQKTISELLKLVGHVTAQQGAESSAVEDVNEDDDDSCAGAELDAADDGGVPNGAHAAPPTRDRPSAVTVRSPPTTSPAPSPQRASPKPITGGGGGRAGAGTFAASLVAEMGEPADESEEAAMEEVRALAGQLERLERDLAGLGNPASPAQAQAAAFKPPPRAPAATTAAARQSPSAAQSAPAASAGSMPAGSPGHMAEMLLKGAGLQQLLAAGGAQGGGNVSGKGSAAALQALAQEMALLEEKKRVVEKLARKLEPPSDEEDDGFPLR